MNLFWLNLKKYGGTKPSLAKFALSLAQLSPSLLSNNVGKQILNLVCNIATVYFLVHKIYCRTKGCPKKKWLSIHIDYFYVSHAYSTKCLVDDRHFPIFCWENVWKNCPFPWCLSYWKSVVYPYSLDNLYFSLYYLTEYPEILSNGTDFLDNCLVPYSLSNHICPTNVLFGNIVLNSYDNLYVSLLYGQVSFILTICPIRSFLSYMIRLNILDIVQLYWFFWTIV